jgi:hypothetical protein
VTSDEQAVRSDRPIDPAMASVLDDATRRLSTPEPADDSAETKAKQDSQDFQDL